jgi:hypothetical protein
VVEKGRTLSKTTQRRAVVAGLSFVLGAAGTIPALAASEGGMPDAETAPHYLDSLGDTLYDLPFVSYLPGQELAEDTGEFVDDAAGGAIGGGGIVGGGGGIVGGLGGIAGGLPIVGPMLGGATSGGGIVGGLPVVGGMLGGGGASIAGDGGGPAGGLPVVGPVLGGVLGGGGGGPLGILGGLLGNATGLLGGVL